MTTFLGAALHLTEADVERELIEGSRAVYLEGYLFDPPEARRAFAKAAALAHGAGRAIAFTLSDAFVVERHREALIGFIESGGRHPLRQRGGDHEPVPGRQFRRGSGSPCAAG